MTSVSRWLVCLGEPVSVIRANRVLVILLMLVFAFSNASVATASPSDSVALSLSAVATAAARDPVPTLVGWGHGELGDGRVGFAYAPRATVITGVLSGKTVTAISTRSGRVCVAAGQAFCWGALDGRSSVGFLGDGRSVGSAVPVAVSTGGALAGKTITAISVGEEHTCVVASGKAYCWGRGPTGALGTGSTDDSLVPVAVDTSGVLHGRVVTGVSAGNGYTCVVADGEAFCWGALTTGGMLGNGSLAGTVRPVAVNTTGALAGLTVTAISAGSSGTCAIADGKPFCWGWPGNVSVGAEASNVTIPVAVDTSGVLHGHVVTAIGTTGKVSCVLADGKPYCWGTGGVGGLGNGSFDDAVVPVAVDTSGELNGRVITGLSVSDTPCVLADGQPFCWGDDTFHPKGLGNLGALSGLSATLIASGPTNCVVAAAKPFCWGDNAAGQLGDGLPVTSVPPLDIAGSGPLAGKRVTALAAAVNHTCVIADNSPWCWGVASADPDPTYSLPYPADPHGVLTGKTLSKIATGPTMTCVIADSAAYCWGANSFGLGNGAAQSIDPVPVGTTGVLTGKNITDVSIGHQTACVIASGRPYCWGSELGGPLGDLTDRGSGYPVAVDMTRALAGKTVTAVSVGGAHTCVLADAKPYCWGTNNFGELGSATLIAAYTPIPVGMDVFTGKSVTAIAAGNFHTCVVADGATYCWGDIRSLGNQDVYDQNTLSGYSTTPVPVDPTGVLAGKAVTSLSAGPDFTCGVADGAAYCWGFNEAVSIGAGLPAPGVLPSKVETGAVSTLPITAVAAAGDSAFALAGGPAPDLPPTTAGRFVPVTPVRVVDSRIGLQVSGAVGPMSAVAVQVAGRGGVPATGVAAVVLNVTVVDPQAVGHLTVWPSGMERTGTSNVNFVAGQTVPNTVIVPVGADGSVQLFNASAGSTDLVVDVSGYVPD